MMSTKPEELVHRAPITCSSLYGRYLTISLIGRLVQDAYVLRHRKDKMPP